MAETAETHGIAPSPAPPRLARVFARRKALAVASIVILAGLGWLYLGLMVAAMLRGGAGALGPGMGLFDALNVGRIDVVGRALIDVLCRPTFGAAPTGNLALVLSMWCAMAFAMMLPTAGPMIVTYGEIAETAAHKREPVVSPLVLTAGYATVWLGFAIAATLLQALLTRLALIDPAMASASALFSGAIFLAAGAYQFSALKRACLTACQRPFPFFFANWSAQPASVFRLGLRQGVYCLGCCWATMLVMFAVGVMNVVWMAALGIVMAVEKVLTTTRFSRAVGVVFLSVGAAFIVSAVLAHWPPRAG